MSPWVRLSENVLDHPRIIDLVDYRRPLDLWIWGLSYSQKHLTDGAIPFKALPPKSDKSAADLVSRGLWESIESGFQVRDYLQWNDSKEVVQSKRAGARSRAKKSRDSHDHRAPHGAVGESSKYLDSLRKNTEIEKPTSGTTDQTLADRAARLLEKYSELYAKHRNGARFRRPLGNLEWLEAVEICRVWDDATLEKLIQILLTTDEEWISKTDRGWKIFNARVQWCAERLAAWEAQRRSA